MEMMISQAGQQRATFGVEDPLAVSLRQSGADLGDYSASEANVALPDGPIHRELGVADEPSVLSRHEC
jgi:hypothetical protein